jgi:Na+-driven multidrug efflux pump
MAGITFIGQVGQAAGARLPFAMRYFVIAIFALIVVSLGSALFYVYRDRSDSTRAVKALALRVGLSIALFLFLMGGYYFGFFKQHL